MMGPESLIVLGLVTLNIAGLLDWFHCLFLGGLRFGLFNLKSKGRTMSREILGVCMEKGDIPSS